MMAQTRTRTHDERSCHERLDVPEFLRQGYDDRRVHSSQTGGVEPRDLATRMGATGCRRAYESVADTHADRGGGTNAAHLVEGWLESDSPG